MSNLQDQIKWDHNKFVEDYQKCNNRIERKKKLKEVTKSNYRIIKTKVSSTPWTIKYDFDRHPEVIQNCICNKKGVVVVEDLTTDDAIVKYASDNNNVIALNFANATSPGGGYIKGSIAQEEDLCRQYPHLYNSLKNCKKSKHDKYYPLTNNHLLITHNVKRYRDNLENGYKVINNPNVSAGFITTAAPNMRTNSNRKKQFCHFKEDISKIFKMVFTAPYYDKLHNYNVLIIGAWGCGAFAPLDPEARVKHITDMANFMVTFANQYRYLYDYISVAIPDQNSENYKIFKNAFSRIK